MKLNQMELVRQIKKEIEKVQLDIERRNEKHLIIAEITGLLGKKEGLELALEIISDPK